IGWLWDDRNSTWCSRDAITGRFSGYVTSASFLSFYAGLRDSTRDAAMLGHAARVSDCVRYMMPSLDPDDSGFQMIRYWRGPVWAVVNWMIGTGLADAGHIELAARMRDDTLTLIATTGFYEAFSPIDGTGSGGSDFSWTAAIWLSWSATA
ncbi:MAG TPA: hypothetical protein VF637_09360, partial [Sphingomicrobium sp.]